MTNMLRKDGNTGLPNWASSRKRVYHALCTAINYRHVEAHSIEVLIEGGWSQGGSLSYHACPVYRVHYKHRYVKHTGAVNRLELVSVRCPAINSELTPTVQQSMKFMRVAK